MKVGKWKCMNSCNSILTPKTKKQIEEELNLLSPEKKFSTLILHEVSKIIENNAFDFIDVVIKKIEYKINETADQCNVNIKVQKHILEKGTIDLTIFVQKKAPETLWFFALTNNQTTAKVFKIIIRLPE